MPAVTFASAGGVDNEQDEGVRHRDAFSGNTLCREGGYEIPGHHWKTVSLTQILSGFQFESAAWGDTSVIIRGLLFRK